MSFFSSNCGLSLKQSDQNKKYVRQDQGNLSSPACCKIRHPQKTIIKSTSQLAKIIDTNNTYALRLEGDCCWELFNEKFFKGDSYKLKAKLPSGFAGIDGFPKFKALSVKKSNPKGKEKIC